MNRLFSSLRYISAIALVGALFIVSGCDKEDPAPTKSTYELIAADPSLSMIKAQIDLNADLKAKLEGTSPVSFFAPNDLAMNAILTTLGLTDFSSISPSVLNTVLNYHLVNSAKTDADLTDGAHITTAQGEDITVVVTSGGAKKLDTGATTDGTVLSSSAATNGTLFVVGDYPLIPPTIGTVIVATLGKVPQPILLGAPFTILAAGIQKADAGKQPAETIVGAMVSMTNQTFFAIPNEVFNAASITVETFTAEQWNGLIRGHMIPQVSVATIETAELTTMLKIPGTTNYFKVTTTASAGSTPPTVKGLGNANGVPVIASSKITTSNGTIFPIGGVIDHTP